MDAHQISSLHDRGDVLWSDFAVFYRTNAQSRVLEEQFLRSGIPYRVVGGLRFYDRREIKDAMAYLRSGGEPPDEVGVQRWCQARGRRPDRRPPRRLRPGARDPVLGALRRWDDAGASARRPGDRAFTTFLTSSPSS